MVDREAEERATGEKRARDFEKGEGIWARLNTNQ